MNLRAVGVTMLASGCGGDCLGEPFDLPRCSRNTGMQETEQYQPSLFLAHHIRNRPTRRQDLGIHLDPDDQRRSILPSRGPLRSLDGIGPVQ